MNIEHCNRIIEGLEVHFYRGSLRKVLRPVQLIDTYEDKNVLVQVKSGNFYTGKENEKVEPGSFFFAPSRQKVTFKHGQSTQYHVFSNEGFKSDQEREQYIIPIPSDAKNDGSHDIFSIVGFDVYVYGAISLFEILELPCMILPYDEELSYLLDHIIFESERQRIGKVSMINCLAKEAIIHLCRSICQKPEFKKNIEKLDFLMDKRLVKIIQYIQANLDKDLSNQAVADVAYVSKDYVGQFFKSLLQMNLQDYIENQRLEKSYFLLRTTSDNVQEISRKVGFNDPAYFSRRFKSKFNMNANQVRRNESPEVVL